MNKLAAIAFAAFAATTSASSAIYLPMSHFVIPTLPAPAEHVSPTEPEVCFYTATDLKHAYFCVHGEHMVLPVEKIWRGRIQSIEVHHASLKICTEAMLSGDCMQTEQTQKALPTAFFNKVRSFQIR